MCTILEHNHFECGLRCGGFAGNLAALEQHELICSMLGPFIPEGLLRDPSNPFDCALPFSSVVTLLWLLLDPLEGAVSGSRLTRLFCDEVLPLEPDD